MGRRPRIHYPGAIYHAMARGVDGRNIFLDERDYRAFMGSLNRIKNDTGATIYAYCLMPNHFHLAIKVADVTLSSIMHRLLTGHAQTFNKRIDRSGHLFQARFKSKICLDDRYLLAVIAYIQANPVRAGLVKNEADWPWSSRVPVQLPNLDMEKFDPWSDEEPPLSMARMPAHVDMTLADIGASICDSEGISIGSLRAKTKNRRIVNARVLTAQAGIRNGHTLAAISEWLGVRPEVVSYYLRKNSTNLLA